MLRQLLLGRRRAMIAEKKRLYDEIIDPAEIVAHQLARFNVVWRRCWETLPFYRVWRERHGLPQAIARPSDLKDFPVLTKAVIQEHHDLVFQHGKIKQAISTGGSTGVPTRFPVSTRQADAAYATLYAARSWWDVQPFDETVLFWGHSHLFGTGLRGVVNTGKRRVLDALINTRRLDAYDMSLRNLATYQRIVHQQRPRVMIGYTSCLYKLARFIESNGLDPGTHGRLKAVIATSETVTESDASLISRVFGAPTVIEYGMAETATIAYSREEPFRLQLLWDAILACVDGDSVLCVTTLLDPLFPLINYQTDDVVDVVEQHEGSVLRLGGVQGRRQDVLSVRSETGSILELSGILMVHVLKSYPEVFGIQFEQVGDDSVRIFVLGDRPLALDRMKHYFVGELHRDDKLVDPAHVEFRQTDQMTTTVAGKERLMRK